MDGSTIRVADPNAWLEIQAREGADYEAYPAAVRFGCGNLTGAFDLDLFDPPGFADELETLHRFLKGQARLVDDDGFGMTLTIDETGHVKAAVRIEGPWPLRIEGWVGFTCAIDQTYLPDLWRAVRETFPPAHRGQRRAGNKPK